MTPAQDWGFALYTIGFFIYWCVKILDYFLPIDFDMIENMFLGPIYNGIVFIIVWWLMEEFMYLNPWLSFVEFLFCVFVFILTVVLLIKDIRFNISAKCQAKEFKKDTEIENQPENKPNFFHKKVDWQALNKSRSELGSAGEDFVKDFETARISEFADVKQIDKISEKDDSAGYDIISLNEDGTDRYIEVKTTTAGLDKPFFMSENERQFFDSNKDKGNTFIYRVYNFDETAKKGDIEIIPASKLFTDYQFNNYTYKVYHEPSTDIH